MAADNSIGTFRYLEFETPTASVPGFCLQYPHRQTALKVFEVLHLYLTAGASPKNCQVKFENGAGSTYRLAIHVQVPENSLNVSIYDIDQKYVDKLERRLKDVGYYVILAGHGSGDTFELLPPERYHFLKSDVAINGRLVQGQSVADVDWENLFRTQG